MTVSHSMIWYPTTQRAMEQTEKTTSRSLTPLSCTAQHTYLSFPSPTHWSFWCGFQRRHKRQFLMELRNWRRYFWWASSFAAEKADEKLGRGTYDVPRHSHDPCRYCIRVKTGMSCRWWLCLSTVWSSRRWIRTHTRWKQQLVWPWLENDTFPLGQRAHCIRSHGVHVRNSWIPKSSSCPWPGELLEVRCCILSQYREGCGFSLAGFWLFANFSIHWQHEFSSFHMDHMLVSKGIKS